MPCSRVSWTRQQLGSQECSHRAIWSQRPQTSDTEDNLANIYIYINAINAIFVHKKSSLEPIHHVLLCKWRCHDSAQEAQGHPHSPAMNSHHGCELQNVGILRTSENICSILQLVEAPTHLWQGHETLSCLQFGMTCRQASQAAAAAACSSWARLWRMRRLFQLRHRDTRDTFEIFREVGPLI